MLNPQTKNQIDYCDYTWNPIRCKCRHGCEYCYMTSLYKRFPDVWSKIPKISKDFKKDIKRLQKMKPSIIFVGSSTDMWGNWIHLELIRKVLSVCNKLQQHRFLFLTKSIHRYSHFVFPANCYDGISIDTNKRVKKYEQWLYKENTFISFEPLLENIKNVSLKGCKWIIIGADSRKGAKKPEKIWIENIINQAKEYNIPVWVKNNIGYPEFLSIKEKPEGLML